MAEGDRVTQAAADALQPQGEGPMEHAVTLTIDDSRLAAERVESLVLEHQTKLARYLRRMVGDAEVAVDLAQDAFLAAYRLLRTDPNRPLTSGWLYKTATNLAISYLRRQKVIRWSLIDSERHGIDLRSDERSAASVDLQAALGKLAPEQAACVMLTTYAGYTSFEAADILGISADAVRQRVCRAMRTLRVVMTNL